MATEPLHRATRHPDQPLPDISIYPVGASHTMPSFAHDEARTVSRAVLRAVSPAQDLVVGELAVLWDPTDYRQHLVPDLMLALGVGELDPVYGIRRLQYRIWDEGRPPDLVVEFASPSTVGRDNLGKKEDYAAIGVPEYVQFDPLGTMLRPRLQVYQLRRGRYDLVAPGRDGLVPSRAVPGYTWARVGDYLRLRDRATGRLVPTPEEAQATAEAARTAAEAARTAAEGQARTEAQARIAAQARAEAAEDEIARLRAEMERLRAALPSDQTPPDPAT